MGNSSADHDTRIAVRLDDQGVVRLTWAPGLYIDESIARAAMRAVDDLNGVHRRPLLVEIGGAAGVTREARKVFTEPCSVSQVALLGRSAVEEVMANFTFLVSVPPVPTRFFTSEPAALAWLRDVPTPR